jgi:amidase
MVEAGRTITAAQLLAAMERQQQLAREVASWWSDDHGGHDLLLTPTTAEPAPPLGEYKRHYAPGRASAFSRVVNATGQPALSLPLGWPDDGLPRGVQLVAAHGREDVLVRVGTQVEEAVPWADRRPPTPP